MTANIFGALTVFGLSCLFGGGGLVWILTKSKVKEIAVEALTEVVKSLKAEDEKLHNRINGNEKDFVSCKYCDRQHNDLNENIKTIKDQNNTILNVLLKKEVC